MGKYSDQLLATEGPAQTAGPGKYSSQLLGIEPAKTAPEQKQESQGWGEWLKTSIAGKRDPSYEGVGSVYQQFPEQLSNPTGSAALAGASDAQMSDIVASTLGERVIRREKDANGYEVFVTRGDDGQEQRGYLNQPGLDREDIARGVRGSLPYVLTGGAAGAATRTLGVGLQALAQAAAAGSTSVAGDLAQMPMGSEQGVEPDKAAVTAGFGAVGPAVGAIGGALWRRFVTMPGLIDSATGQLTAKGIEAARRAGVDPADITPDFSKRFADSYATTGNEAVAKSTAERGRFGIPASEGQATKDPFLLTQEEGMRRRLYGETAQNKMLAFDKEQQDAIAEAALGQYGMAGRLQPARKSLQAPFERSPGSLGESVQSGFRTAKSGAKAAEREAWEGTKGLTATPEAFATLPDTLAKRLSDVTVDTQLTPAAARMGKELDRFIAGQAPEEVAGVLKQMPVQDVGQMRKRLLGFYRAAATAEDKKAAQAVYNGYNDWLSESAANSLLAGDPAAAMNMVKARGFTKEVSELFQPSNATGRKSAAASRLAKIENADSGESVVHALFGSQGSRGMSEGAVETLSNLKTALDRFAPKDVAEQSWNDVRLAYWTRLVTGKNGELLGSTAMMNNIKSAMTGQRSIVGRLFTPMERSELAHFVRALETVSYRPPNASGSGYSAATFAKEGILKFLDSFGLGTPARAALDYSGVGNALAGVRASRAVRQIAPVRRPNITPAVVSAGQAYQRSASD